MGEQLTDEEMAECKRAFALYDRDGDGYISTRELGVCMKTMGYNPTENEVIDILNEVDTDGLGEITFPEFLTLMAKKLKEYEGEESLRLAFQVFDKNNVGKGVISERENRVRTYSTETVARAVEVNNTFQTPIIFEIFPVVLVYNFDGETAKVSVSDFQYMMDNLKVTLTEHEINDMIKDADKSHTGYITYDEFITQLSGK